MFLPVYDPAVSLFTRQAALHAHVLQHFSWQPKQRVLDVGCGSGTFMCALASQSPDLQLTAIDIDARILRQAVCKAGASHIQWLRGAASDLPLESASFDTVTCELLLHHLTPAEKQASLAEIYRVLRPGGQLILVDYAQPASVLAYLQFLPVRLIDGWSRTGGNVSGQIPSLIEQAGFLPAQETKNFWTLLGTVRCYAAVRE